MLQETTSLIEISGYKQEQGLSYVQKDNGTSVVSALQTISTEIQLPEHLNQFLQAYCDKDYQIYGNYGWVWYRRFAKYFVDVGIPEKGVVNLIEKHPIPSMLIKKHGRTSGLVPETVAKNVLKYRHSRKEYDSLATPKIRITRKKVANYRIRLEIEIRRLWSEAKRPDLQEVLNEDCINMTDEEIAKLIMEGRSPESHAKTILYIYEM